MSETTDVLRLVDLPADDSEFFACEEGENHEPLSAGLMPFGTTSRHVLASWLPAAFRKWGVKYKIVEGAADRGRPISAGYFDPNALLIHHTGSTSSASRPAPSLNTVTFGRSDLKGPLCQVSTDYNGLTYVVAYGRANHAGSAKAAMGNPSGDGNAMYLGNEVQTSGTQKMPQAQYDALVLSSAAILDHFGYKDASKLGLHHTTSKSGKWDLGEGTGRYEPYSITKLRADVTARLKAGPPRPTPTPAPVAKKEITVFALVQIRGTDPVYKSDGFRRQHIGKVQLAGLKKSGLQVIELANQTELDGYGVLEPNPAGQK